VVGIEARCIICSVTQEAEPGEDVPEIRMRLQITDLGIGGAQPGRTAADALYGPENE
jgi:hypothetical protein